jgi:hypothetical protein
MNHREEALRVGWTEGGRNCSRLTAPLAAAFAVRCLSIMKKHQHPPEKTSSCTLIGVATSLPHEMLYSGIVRRAERPEDDHRQDPYPRGKSVSLSA